MNVEQVQAGAIEWGIFSNIQNEITVQSCIQAILSHDLFLLGQTFQSIILIIKYEF